MNANRLIRIACVLLLGYAGVSIAELPVYIDSDVRTCPAGGLGASIGQVSSPAVEPLMPNFTSSNCQQTQISRVDPYNTELWIKAALSVKKDSFDGTQPLGLFISAKMSSRAYLNGQLIGQNGTPAGSPTNEVAGRMDALFHVPGSLLHDGENELILQVSSHHGFLHLRQSIHWIRLDTYHDPTTGRLEHYWPSLLPFGVLFLGALCFGLLAIIQRRGWQTAFLPLMSLFAAGQLCFEVSRGLVPYIYPFQDLRLILILVSTLGFGMSLLAHSLTVLMVDNKKSWFTVCTGATILLVLLQPGFDTKSSLATAIPALVSLILGIRFVVRKQPAAGSLVLALGSFLLVLLLAPSEFLDTYFFYIVATFLAVLFVQQILSYAREREARAREKARADKLQLVIDQNHAESSLRTLSVTKGNHSELIVIADISYCKGAGDYVNLVMDTGITLLHNDSLHDLEQNLPSTFLRVHRSYIVNTAKISTLERKASGTGLIVLKNGERVPVSRRIMPNVRERLS